MDEAAGKSNTDGNGGAALPNNPHQITHQEWMRSRDPYLRMRVRLVHLKQQYDAPGADRLNLGVAALGEVQKFLQADPWFHQSEAGAPMMRILFALTRWIEGKRDPLLFDRPTGQGSKEISSVNWLRAVTAHAVAVMRAGDQARGAFAPKAAADVVANQFKKKGFRGNVPRMKGEFIHTALVWQWHDKVAGGYANKLARDTFDRLQQDHAAFYPEHRQWSPDRRREWLKHYVNDLCRLERSGSFS